MICRLSILRREQMKVSYVLICVMLCMGCATFSVNQDFDPEYDFAGVKTYDWLPMPEKSQINEIALKRIKIAVNQELKTKGLQMSAETPDMLIALRAGREKRMDVQEWGYGYDDRDYYHGAWFPGRVPVEPAGRDYFEYRRGVDTYEYEVGTLVLDFVDAKKKELVWRGTASGIIDPTKTSEQINEVVAKLLENFPPLEKK